MANEERLIIQVARGGAVERQLNAMAPDGPYRRDVVLDVGPTSADGYLEPPAVGKVVASVPSPEALTREAGEIRRVIASAGAGVEPLVVVVEAAEELRDDELEAILDAAGHAPRPVILRIIRDA